ncbi:hypothetical protein [Pseudomonas asplenii]|uniref:Uncharacterized protein n=1 Tax=Pseudomonas asplenii TaxID=53407 RepID=A0A1H6P203_9PSED|nr:hypothetical protein [Pseudomonas fuscovaginae]SEI21421.1 hypothetical protein SAMN05216581_4497 [Pseudomonas fuscovaginae]
MSQQAKRFDTLVICGATSKDVPREVFGGEVVSWAAGHALAEADPLMVLVSDLAKGILNVDAAVRDEAKRVLGLSRHQRDHGWPDLDQDSEVPIDPPETVEELKEALIKESQRYNDLYIQYANHIDIAERVSQDLAAMCEAHLAGDSKTASRKLSEFAQAYRKNTRPVAGEVH